MFLILVTVWQKFYTITGWNTHENPPEYILPLKLHPLKSLCNTHLYHKLTVSSSSLSLSLLFLPPPFHSNSFLFLCCPNITSLPSFPLLLHTLSFPSYTHTQHQHVVMQNITHCTQHSALSMVFEMRCSLTLVLHAPNKSSVVDSNKFTGHDDLNRSQRQFINA